MLHLSKKVTFQNLTGISSKLPICSKLPGYTTDHIEILAIINFTMHPPIKESIVLFKKPS